MSEIPITDLLLDALDTGSTVLTQRVLNEPTQPPRFLWDRLMLAGEVGTFVGGSGAGKSRLLCGLAVAIASGRGEFLGYACQSGTVAVISSEDGVEFYRRQVKAWCVHFDVPFQLIGSKIRIYDLPEIIPAGYPASLTVHDRGGVVVNVPLVSAITRSLNQSGLHYSQHVEAVADDEPIPSGAGANALRLVIAETASTLSVGDESNEAMRELIRALASIAHTGLSAPAVAVTHHATKAEMEKQEPLTVGSGRGGYAFTANARGALTLGKERLSQADAVLRCQKVRDGRVDDLPPIFLDFEEVEVDGHEEAVLVPASNTPAAYVPAGQASPLEGANGGGRAKVGRPSTDSPAARAAAMLAIAQVVTSYADREGPPTRWEVLSESLVVEAGLGRGPLRTLLDALITAGCLAVGPSRQGAKFTLVPGKRFAEMKFAAETKLAETSGQGGGENH